MKAPRAQLGAFFSLLKCRHKYRTVEGKLDDYHLGLSPRLIYVHHSRATFRKSSLIGAIAEIVRD